MHKIIDKLMKELKEYERKPELEFADIDILYKLTDIVKNIYKIEMLEEASYSNDGGDWEARGSYRGNSYDDDSSFANAYSQRRKRDRMGRYSRDDGMSREGGYARDSGRSHKGGYSGDGRVDHLIDKMSEMLETAEDKDRDALRHCIEKLENIRD